jgi:hypothetical protein
MGPPLGGPFTNHKSQITIDQKSTVALNRTNRAFRIAVSRSHVLPSEPNAWLKVVPVFALNRL